MKVEQFIVGTMGVCCYLVSCETTGKAALIDTGAEAEMLLAEVEKAGLTLEYIISTHGHPDHVHCNRVIAEKTGAKIVMHKDDVSFFQEQEAIQYFSHLGMEFSPHADIEVVDGDVIKIGDEELRVIHTPGHTPGGMCLLGAGNLFSGDTLFVGAAGRTDFPGGDYPKLMDSIKNKLVVLDEKTIVWPGHGYGGTCSNIRVEKRTNSFCR